MTDAKETIIKSALKYLVKMQIEQGSVGFAVDNDHDHDCCWDDVLAWIEAQPSEDCISRQAVLDVINFEDKWLFDANGHNANTHIAFSGLESRVKALPSVKPERPKGKWIEDTQTGFKIRCSECGARNFGAFRNYCPNCSSYNAEIKESADDDAFSD